MVGEAEFRSLIYSFSAASFVICSRALLGKRMEPFLLTNAEHGRLSLRCILLIS